MTLYEILIQLAQNSYNKIHINLASKTLVVGRKTIIDNREVVQHKITVNGDSYEFDEFINEEHNLNELYRQYKTSIPGEKDGGHHYFKALSASELTDAQLVLNMQRLEARVRLEAYILLASLNGILTWTWPDNWYWQSQEDPDFVILKKYIEKGE